MSFSNELIYSPVFSRWAKLSDAVRASFSSTFLCVRLHANLHELTWLHCIAHFWIVVRVAHWQFTAALSRFGCLFFCSVVFRSLIIHRWFRSKSKCSQWKIAPNSWHWCTAALLRSACVCVCAWCDNHNMVLPLMPLMLKPISTITLQRIHTVRSSKIQESLRFSC